MTILERIQAELAARVEAKCVTLAEADDAMERARVRPNDKFGANPSDVGIAILADDALNIGAYHSA